MASRVYALAMGYEYCGWGLAPVDIAWLSSLDLYLGRLALSLELYNSAAKSLGSLERYVL